MRHGLVVGNWKMNGSRALAREMATACVEAQDGAALAVCPPHVLIAELDEVAPMTLAVGAQDCSEHAEPGAYTGEVSASMLQEAGCQYVIVGHSERRAYHAEDDGRVAAKFAAAKAAGLVPILCVGETLEERDAGRTEEVVARQVDAVGGQAGAFRDAVIAYEPVWAIGTGRTATPEQAQAVHALIRARVRAAEPGVEHSVPLLYGGSVKADNAAGLFAEDDIDGALVGGASLDPEGFLAIWRAMPATKG